MKKVSFMGALFMILLVFSVSKSYAVDVSGLETGMYIIKVTNSDNSSPISFKITKQ